LFDAEEDSESNAKNSGKILYYIWSNDLYKIGGCIYIGLSFMLLPSLCPFRQIFCAFTFVLVDQSD
jgi:hypothetical protein